MSARRAAMRREARARAKAAVSEDILYLDVSPGGGIPFPVMDGNGDICGLPMPSPPGLPPFQCTLDVDHSGLIHLATDDDHRCFAVWVDYDVPFVTADDWEADEAMQARLGIEAP